MHSSKYVHRAVLEFFINIIAGHGDLGNNWILALSHSGFFPTSTVLPRRPCGSR